MSYRAHQARQLARRREKRSRLTQRILSMRQRFRAQLDKAKQTIRDRDEEVTDERIKRVAAQIGLVNYMTEAGLGHRIGYDPRQDPALRQLVAEGKLPLLEDFPLRPYRTLS